MWTSLEIYNRISKGNNTPGTSDFLVQAVCVCALLLLGYGSWALAVRLCLWATAVGLRQFGYRCWAMAIGQWLLGYICWATAVGLWLLGYGCWATAIGLQLMGYGCWVTVVVWLLSKTAKFDIHRNKEVNKDFYLLKELMKVCCLDTMRIFGVRT